MGIEKIDKGYKFTEKPKYLDFINLITYDLRGVKVFEMCVFD